MYCFELHNNIIDDTYCKYNIELVDMESITRSKKIISLQHKSIQENIEYFIQRRTLLLRNSPSVLSCVDEEKEILYDIINKFMPFPKGLHLYKLFDDISNIIKYYNTYHQSVPIWFHKKYNKK